MTSLPDDLQSELRALLSGGDPAVIAERVRTLPPEEIARLLVALHLNVALGWAWARLAEWLLGAKSPEAVAVPAAA